MPRRSDVPCTVDDCGRPRRYADGLCRAHHGQRVAGQPLGPVRRVGVLQERPGERCCNDCERWLPLADFAGNRRGCRRCGARRARYGINSATFDTMLAAQDGGCAVCGTSEPGGRWGTWHVDHDHDCCPGSTTCGRCFAGLLCCRCNQGIGFFGDDPARLRAAAAYVGRVRRRHADGTD